MASEINRRESVKFGANLEHIINFEVVQRISINYRLTPAKTIGKV
jgi:hypothetical protein